MNTTLELAKDIQFSVAHLAKLAHACPEPTDGIMAVQFFIVDGKLKVLIEALGGEKAECHS